jgi:Arc/MetJ-type ribon-helix-helix transcriptional regulator
MARRSKPTEERVVNAGISLPPRFINEIRAAAQAEGFETLTTLVRYLLTQWLQQMHHKWEVEELMRETAKEQAKRPPEEPGRPRRGRPRKT